MTAGDTVYVVDDDPSVREAVSSLLRSVGVHVVALASAADFLAVQRTDRPSCLVLDVRMPGLNGMELQRMLVERGASVPIVFITGHGDIPMAVRAIKAGAVEFLTKPFRDHELLDAIRAAMQRDAAEREHDNALEILRQRYATLTDREREVLPHVVSGMLNKQIGASLGISEQTVKVHRHHIMRKLSAGSLPDLVRMMEPLRLGRETPKTCSPEPS